MESTPNGRNDFWHNLWRRAEAGKIDWYPIYIPFYLREKTYSHANSEDRSIRRH